MPPETLFYSLIFANESRYDRHPVGATEVMDYLQQQLADVGVLQVGGDETTGKGLCAVQLLKGKEGVK